MWTASLLVGLLAQDPQPDAQKAAVPVSEQPFQAPRSWTDAEAKAALVEYERAGKRRGPRLADRLAALEALRAGSHRLLVRPLQIAVRAEKHVSARALAAQALGGQPAAEARPAIVELLRDKDITDHPAIAVELVLALARAGYRPQDWPALEELFERELAPQRVNLQRAILELVIAHKEKQAARMLLQHVDEPFPDNVDDASNPPTEYWEKRWKAWKQWRPLVLDALYAITGQRFHCADEARKWIKANGEKIGVRI
jgi:hypothetical protein